MEKVIIDFSGPGSSDYSGINEVSQEVSRLVDKERESILSAKKLGQPVTVILPAQGVKAVALIQAVRGLLGRTPFVQSPEGGEEIDIESIREAFRESL